MIPFECYFFFLFSTLFHFVAWFWFLCFLFWPSVSVAYSRSHLFHSSIVIRVIHCHNSESNAIKMNNIRLCAILRFSVVYCSIYAHHSHLKRCSKIWDKYLKWQEQNACTHRTVKRCTVFHSYATNTLVFEFNIFFYLIKIVSLITDKPFSIRCGDVLSGLGRPCHFANINDSSCLTIATIEIEQRYHEHSHSKWCASATACTQQKPPSHTLRHRKYRKSTSEWRWALILLFRFDLFLFLRH